MKIIKGNKRLAAILLVFVLVASTLLSYGYLVNQEGGTYIKAAGLDLSEYDEDNPLKVVEIVPYIMFATMGYHIAGGEIVDYDEMCRLQETKSNLPNGVSPAWAFDGHDMVGRKEFSVGGKNMFVLFSLEKFKRYSLGMGIVDEESVVDKDLLGKQAIRRRLEIESNNLENTNEFIAACKTALETTYAYKGNEEKLLDDFNKVKVVYQAYLMSEVNKDPSVIDDADLLFINAKEMFGNSNRFRSFLNSTYLKKLRGCYDVNGKIDDSLFWKNGNTDYETNVISLNYYYVDTNPLNEPQMPSWKTVQHIFERCTDIDGPSIIMHKTQLTTLPESTKKVVNSKYTYLKDTGERVASDVFYGSQVGSNSNISKLYIMIFAKDSYEFRDDYYRYVDSNGNFTLQEGDAASYWGFFTFYDYDPKYASSPSGSPMNQFDNVTTYHPILNQTGYVWNSDNALTGGFSTATEFNTSGMNSDKVIGDTVVNNSEKVDITVVDHFGQNGKVTPADSLGYLLLEKNRRIYDKNSMRILEVQPSNEFTSTNEDIKKYFPGYKAGIIVDRMTSAEFNASQLDLIGTYDIIILGGNTGGLSQEVNDSAYKDMIYTHTGDRIKISGSSSDEYYSGNDITDGKLKDLQAYVEAGLPVILGNSLYEIKNIDKASNMYLFLTGITKEQKEDYQIVNELKCKTRATSTAIKMMPYLNLERPGIVNLSASATSEKVSISFTTGVTSKNIEHSYTAQLYLDINGDGVLESEPYKTIDVPEEGGYTISYSGDSMVDAPPTFLYKVVVVANEDSNRNSSKFGQVDYKSSISEVNVLQIAPNTETTIDISSDTDLVAKKLKFLDNYNFKLKTVTIEEFESWYDPSKEGMEFDTSNIISDQLINYDVIIFGTSKEYPVINNNHGALDNVLAHLNRDKSVIFTNSVLDEKHTYPNDETKESYDTFRKLAGMNRYDSDKDQPIKLNETSTVTTTGFTYGFLNHNIASGSIFSMYNFSGVTTSGREAFETTYITKINTGHVTEYPYEIDEVEFVQNAGGYEVDKSLEQLTTAKTFYGSYQLDLEDTSNVIGYYALGNNDANARNMYSTSPNDIRNNYYLYKNNRVWYSGIGYATLSASNTEEAELFVNTIVGAYNNAKKTPSVEFLNVHVDTQGNNLTFIDMDINGTKGTKDVEIDWKGIDPMVRYQDLKTTILLQCGDQVYDITEVTRIGDGKVLSIIGDKMLVKETPYRVIADKEKLTTKKMYLYIYVDNGIGTGMGKVEIKRRNDFNLD